MSSEADVIALRPVSTKTAGAVYFVRAELAAILNIYGRRVAAGDWRDYALDFERDYACFSIFRRASEAPLYRIIKEPRLRGRQGMWRITAMDGRVLKRGHSLDTLLGYFDKKPAE